MKDDGITVWITHFPDRPALQLQWIDPDTGKRRTRSSGTADPDQAEQARAKLQEELNAGQTQPSRLSWPRFRELFEEEYLPGVRDRTQEYYRQVLSDFGQLAGPGRVAAITERNVSTFLHGLRARGLAASTLKVRLAYLHGVLGWAAAQGFLAQVPKFPEVKVPRKRPQPVDPAHVERLLTACREDQELRTYLLCGWLAGLRRNEALALEWEPTDTAPWLDFNRKRIWLPAALVKADEDQWVPIDPALQAALEALPRRFGPRVFPGLPRPTALSERIRLLARRAGVKLTMKTLRRGFGCRYAGQVPAQVLQKLMRHSDLKTTLQYYVNLDSAVEAAVLGQSNSSDNGVAQDRPAA